MTLSPHTLASRTDRRGWRDHLGFKNPGVGDYAPAGAITGVPTGRCASSQEFATTPQPSPCNRSASMQSNGLFNQMAVEALNAWWAA